MYIHTYIRTYIHVIACTYIYIYIYEGEKMHDTICESAHKRRIYINIPRIT